MSRASRGSLKLVHRSANVISSCFALDADFFSLAMNHDLVLVVAHLMLFRLFYLVVGVEIFTKIELNA